MSYFIFGSINFSIPEQESELESKSNIFFVFKGKNFPNSSIVIELLEELGQKIGMQNNIPFLLTSHSEDDVSDTLIEIKNQANELPSYVLSNLNQIQNMIEKELYNPGVYSINFGISDGFDIKENFTKKTIKVNQFVNEVNNYYCKHHDFHGLFFKIFK